MRFGKKRAVPTAEIWIIGGVLNRSSAQLFELPSEQRRELMLIGLEGMSYTETAAILISRPAPSLAAISRSRGRAVAHADIGVTARARMDTTPAIALAT
jgi:hypothetical protein